MEHDLTRAGSMWKEPHAHCWHPTTKPLFVVLKDGYVHQTCCVCGAGRSVHAAHAAAK